MIKAGASRLQDRVLIKVAEEDAQSVGGIILTAQSSDKPTVGEVIAVGPGAPPADAKDPETAAPEPVKCPVGAQVLYSKYSGVELEDEAGTYVVVREADVLAVLA